MTDSKVGKNVVYEPEPSSNVPKADAMSVIPVMGGHYVVVFGKVLREDETNVYQKQVAAAAVYSMEELIMLRNKMNDIIEAEKDRLEL